MPNSFDGSNAPRGPGFLWRNLRSQTFPAPGCAAEGSSDVCGVSPLMPAFDAAQANEASALPRFLCFELAEPEPPRPQNLANNGRACPHVLVLIITDCSPGAVAVWTRGAGVDDFHEQPISINEFGQRLGGLVELTRQSGQRPSHDIPSGTQESGTHSVPNGACAQNRTHPAIAYVTSNFNQKIALDHVAALCRLSPSRFCRVFRQEQGVSFAQHLIRYRIEQACKRLAHPGALAKEVAYSCGFNDLSYFARAFRQHLGICPSTYQRQHDCPNG
jgi:two-component system, response regulator YesN